MGVHNDSVPGEGQSVSPSGGDSSRRLLLAIGLLAAAAIVALAFGAYRQPELLLNFMGLRYCG
jgi:preprotein translocase subunit SecD